MTAGHWWIVSWCAFFIVWRLWDEFVWDADDTRHPPHTWEVGG